VLPMVSVHRDNQEIKSNKRSLYNRRYRLLDDISLKIAETIKTLI